MLYESPIVMAYCVCVAVVLGLCMGSFLNCLAWRMTHHESVLKGRSHCTSCGHVLAARDLIPVVSWVQMRGRCRYCGERVSVRYPAVECLCAIVYVSLLLRYGLSLETVMLVCFASILLVLSLTDLDDYIIPNATIVAAIAIRLAYIAIGGMLGLFDAGEMLCSSLIGGVAVGLPVLLLALVMDRVLGRDSLGGGDIKLLFVAGMYFGWQQCMFLLIVACILGIVLGMFSSKGSQDSDVLGEGEDEDGSANKDLDDGEPAHASRPIPFGPAIALACWVTMLVAPQVLSWYLGLFGF